MNTFVNEVYANLERRVRIYSENKIGNFDDIMRDIREASLYGKIESYEEIRLMDLMNLDTAEDIDDGYVEVHDRTTGGIQTTFKEEEKHDMSYLDDFEEEEEEKDTGFLGFLNL